MPSKKKRAPKRLGEAKRGRLSAEEIGFIKGKAGAMSAEAIAKKLGRAVEQVQRALDSYTGIKPERMMSLEEQLVTRSEWRQFQKQFTREELEEFKHQYVQMMSTQFKDDLLPTEELQLFQVITLKILIDRTLAEQRLALEDMQSAHADIELMKGMELNDEDRARLMRAYDTYEASKKTNRECADRYKIYSDKQDKLFKDLKSTRDQRKKLYEDSKGSMLGWIRLLMEEESREEWGNESEMMKLAAEKEKKRLQTPFVYDDGTEDKPLLTPESA